jgi:hypothetical protein
MREGQTLASRAAHLAQRTLLVAIQRDWARTQNDLAVAAAGFSAEWFRGIDTTLSISKFKKQWASPPFFCEVLEQAGQPPTMQLRVGGQLCPV